MVGSDAPASYWGRWLEGNKGCMKQTWEFRNQNLRGHAAGKLIGGKGMTVVSGVAGMVMIHELVYPSWEFSKFTSLGLGRWDFCSVGGTCWFLWIVSRLFTFTHGTYIDCHITMCWVHVLLELVPISLSSKCKERYMLVNISEYYHG